MIVKDYKNNGERIAYTLDYDIFSVNVEHKKTSEGVDVTDLKGLFDWLDEQEVSKVPLESFLSFQNSLLLEGESLDFAMSERKMTQKEIDVVLVGIEEQFLETWEEGELSEYSLDEVDFPDYKELNFVCRLKQHMKKLIDTKLEEGMYYRVSLLNVYNDEVSIEIKGESENIPMEYIELYNLAPMLD